jgi:hypothetical protein
MNGCIWSVPAMSQNPPTVARSRGRADPHLDAAVTRRRGAREAPVSGRISVTLLDTLSLAHQVHRTVHDSASIT